jgi:hypothetical protein
MIGTVIAIGVGVVVIAFACWSVYSDLRGVPYYRPRHRRHRF